MSPSNDIRLSPERYAELVEAERQLHEALAEMDKAEECGIDCSALRQKRQDAFDLAQAIKKNYKPLH